MPAAAIGRALLLRGCVQQRQQAGVAQAAHDSHLMLCLANLVLAAAQHLGRRAEEGGGTVLKAKGVLAALPSAAK